MCHIKTTSNERFTNTVHFSHRKLTRPTITHADKVMVAIAYWAKVIKNLGNGNQRNKKLILLIKRSIHHELHIAATPTTTAHNPASLRVHLTNTNNNSRQTRSMTQSTQHLSTISTPVVLRVEQSMVAKNRIRKKSHKSTISTTSPAHNTRSITQRTETPPSSRTRSRTRIARMKNKKQTGWASRVERTIAQLENDVHQSLVVMEADTSKLLNYRQLMGNPKYNKIEACHLQMNLYT